MFSSHFVVLETVFAQHLDHTEHWLATQKHMTVLPVNYHETIVNPTETAARVAQFLRQQGRQAWALRGGLAAWRAAQYPMESKHAGHAPGPEEECPDCHEEVGAHIA